MTPLPPPLGGGELRFWRLPAEKHALSWQMGEGSFRVGGRWNSPGIRAVYTPLDPATATLEVAVHKGFHYFTAQPCKHGHVAPRQRAGRGCAGCEQAFQQGDTARAAKLRYSQSDHGKSVIRKYHKEIWNGSPGDRADIRKYELRKLKAAPKWLTKEQLREIVGIYADADRRAATTGVPHHVDHVVPLVAKHPVTRQHVACGLHVPWNLRVETAADNLTKGCYFDGWA